MTEEGLQEEQRRDFEARRETAFTRLMFALNEGDAEIWDIWIEKDAKGEDVATIYYKDGTNETVNIHGDTIITAIREVLNRSRLKGM